MSPEKQMRVIAEACGIHVVPFIPKGPTTRWARFNELPDYLHDLNAMREAILAQPSEVQKAIRAELWRITSQMDVLPPADKYAEAFLRVIDKWEDE